VVPVVELLAERGARLTYAEVQDRGPRVRQLAWQTAVGGQEATISVAQAALGASWARTRLDCRLQGRGATANLSTAYFGERDQTLEFRTFQHHEAPDTTSDLLFSGAVGGSSRAVYTGLIRITPEGRRTNAVQANRTLKLSDTAWAESVPNLEIETNDVRCAHASAVGPVDPDQRWYLESRGVEPARAERLIVGGFFDDVLARFPSPAAAVLVRAAIDQRLDGELG